MVNTRHLSIGSAVLAYLVGGFFVAQIMAGAFYFVLNKTLPENFDLGTWWAYWDHYNQNPLQRKRLQISAGLAAGLVYLVPCFVLAQHPPLPAWGRPVRHGLGGPASRPPW
jgi:type IV secretion system protein VirD4